MRLAAALAAASAPLSAQELRDVGFETVRYAAPGVQALRPVGRPVRGLAVSPRGPDRDPNFLLLPDGRDLAKVNVSGTPLRLARGAGQTMGAAARRAYDILRKEAKSTPDHPVQWVLMDLDSRRIVDQSASPGKVLFGASTSKIYVAATLLDKQDGALPGDQLQLMADMLAVSSNDAWLELQRRIGGGNADAGRQANLDFTRRLGRARTRGFQGSLGGLHGNELLAGELADFLHDTYHGRYPGAIVLWKLMHTCRTGRERALKYLPASLVVGGKTGTYDGPTINPDTGGSTNPDGSAYAVKVRNHAIVFHANGRQYGLAILADTGQDESAALIAGGLYRELAQAP